MGLLWLPDEDELADCAEMVAWTHDSAFGSDDIKGSLIARDLGRDKSRLIGASN